MLISSLVALTISIAEARVFCHDPYAAPFKALGFSCTITCNTILSAIDRLKQIEYQRLVIEHGSKLSDKKNSTNAQKYSQRRGIEQHAEAAKIYTKTYEAYESIELSQQYLTDFRALISNLTSMLNVTCYVNANRSRLLRKILNECTGDAKERCRGCILKMFKKFFHTYAHSDHPFDTSMILIIVKLILKNVNIRNGSMTESGVLYLKRELRPYAYRPPVLKKDTVNLQYKHCMSVFMPGCYCKEGYIEDLGRCVQPANCSKGADFEKYLKRVILH